MISYQQISLQFFDFKILQLVSTLLQNKPEIKPFSEIQMMNVKLSALFIDLDDDSSKSAVDLFTELADEYPDTKFFIIDKADENNAKLFQLKDFEVLPQIFVLIPEERISEPMIGEFNEQNVRNFLQQKMMKINLDDIQNVTQKEQLTEGESVIMFTNNQCKTCEGILYSLKRAAQILKIQTKVVNCDDNQEICTEMSIEQVPYLFVSVNGSMTEISSRQTSQIIDEVRYAQNQTAEERQNMMQAQDVKRSQRSQLKKEQILKTDIKIRLDELERKVQDMEMKLNLVQDLDEQQDKKDEL